MTGDRPLEVVPIEWEVRYPVEAEPIGVVRRVRLDGAWRFRAIGMGSRIIGSFPDGDSAAVAIWETYLVAHRADHEVASRTHGGSERHVRPGTREAPPRPPSRG